MCAQWNCSAGTKITQQCDGIDGCELTKCADTLQCVHRKSICDGKFDCKDKSDELCNDGCLKKRLMPWEEDIVKKCQEDLHRCVSVRQYCDGIAHCPDGSDEIDSGCTCEDWSLSSCTRDVNQQLYCMNKNWAPTDGLDQSSFECQTFLHNINTLKEENNTGQHYF